MFTEDGLGHSADEEWATNRVLVSKAAELASELGAPYLSTEVGFVNKDWNLALERVKAACDMCSAEGVTFLIESGQESGAEMKKFLEDLEKKYPGIKIGVNFDPANHILYDTDTPDNAFDILRPWIKQVHVKDCLLDASRRNSWSEDIVWGTGDVSGKFDFLQHVYDSGYKGNLLVEHESGDNRVADIEVALKALLL
ncbi:MAG: sugar phosphate isomerase/epimerase, partial [Bacteroidales bacterium]|nr:sugar phosphate isomerase/epimerase [Candidatus Cryptobacteroides aphodequi]